MNWLIWKQHHKQFMLLAVLLGLYAVLAIPLGHSLWHIYNDALVACSKTSTCDDLASTLFQSGWSSLLNPNAGDGLRLMDVPILAVPFLLGIFLGVPLITREYTAGTNLLVWTRSISRRQWLTTKLAWLLVVAALFAGIFTALTMWWAKAGNALYLNHFSAVMFDIQGIVPVGYAVLAVSIGIALGARLKRTMVAIGLTLVMMIAIQVVVANFVRPHYMTPVTKSVVTNEFGGGLDSTQRPSGALVTDYKIVNNEGQVLDWINPPKQCIVAADDLPGRNNNGGSGAMHGLGNSSNGSMNGVAGGPIVKGACLQSLGYHYVIDYQPSDRYWKFQEIELALYLGLAAIAIASTYWFVLKQDA